MEYIDFEKLQQTLPQLRADYQSKKPFRYLMFENFFRADQADLIHDNFPTIDNVSWNGTTYIDQKNKFQKSKFEKDTLFDKVFGELNSPDFLKWLEELTVVEEPLIPDNELFGGGLHQSINGAFQIGRAHV